MNFAEHVKVREEKFGSVIFDTLREKVFVVNQSGKCISHLLEKGNSEEEIIDSLADSYEINPEDIRNDVVSFINLLKDNKLIT